MLCFQVEELEQSQQASRDEAMMYKRQYEQLQQQLEACQQALQVNTTI